MRKAAMFAAATTMTVGVLAGGLVASPASAAPVIQDGLVNVNVGDVTILKDVKVGVAANVVAVICGVNVGPVAVLGRAVDATGTRDTICRVDGAPIKIKQNR